MLQAIKVRDGEGLTRRRNYRLPMSMNWQRGYTATMSERNITAMRALYRCEKEGRDPTPTELDELARYAGFGGCQIVFDRVSNQQRYEGVVTHDGEIAELLHDYDYRDVKRSIPYAYYTPPPVARALWDTVAALGFSGGLVLDPAFGTGNIAGSIPDDLAQTTQIVGLDNDGVAARIGAMLYPESEVYHARFQDMDVSPMFDAVISNFPFGQDPVADKRYDGQATKMVLAKIHNYFLGKSLDMLRSGGVMAIITSRYFLDSNDMSMRRYVARRARLVGAFRLPSKTFAGTGVVSDILVFQKRDKVLPRFRKGWTDRGTIEMPAYIPMSAYKDGSWQRRQKLAEHPIGAYFLKHGDHVFGEYKEVSGRFGPEPTVRGDIEMLPQQLAEKIRGVLTEGVYQDRVMECDLCGKATHQRLVNLCKSCQAGSENAEEVGISFNSAVLEGQYFLGSDKRIYQREGGKAIMVNRPTKILYRIKHMLVLLELAERVNSADTDAELSAAVRKLTLAYSRYVGRYGYVNSRANRSAFSKDPRSPLVFALEYWDEETKIGKPAEIFRRTSVRKGEWPQVADTVEKAVGLSLARYNAIDWGYISKLTGMSEQDAMQTLNGKVFLDPRTGWQPAESYLSGDVVTKLEEARSARHTSGLELYDANVRALESVQPPRLHGGEIWAGLGATWIPARVVKRFVDEMLDEDSPLNCAWDLRTNGELDGDELEAAIAKVYAQPYEPSDMASVSCVARLGTWTCEAGWGGSRKMARTRWGTDRVGAVEVMHATLNGSRITVRDRNFKTDKQEVNKVETVAAREKSKEMQRAFEQWLWLNPERCAEMEDLYNDKLNRHVVREYDGSHLLFPDMNPDIVLRPKQLDVIWRGLQTGNLIMWHRVGAGKTFAMIALSMEMRRLGMADRPIHVVPNHLLGQYMQEFYRLYPRAKILGIDSGMLSPKNRARYLAYMVTGDFDALIVTHSAFKLIPVAPETWKDFIQRELDMVESDLIDAKADDEDRLNIRALERHKGRLEARLEKVQARAKNDRDYGVYWKDLNADAVFLDEAHHVRNLYYATKRNGLPGIGGGESGTAFDFFVKTQLMLRRCVCGRPLGVNRQCQCVRNERARTGKLVMATGTLLTNSVAELYTFMRYTMYDRLEDLGLSHFDSWASQFGQTVTMIEMNPSGVGFRQNERFVRFHNVPELQNLLAEVCDAQLDVDALGLELPALEGGEAERIECEPSEAQLDIFTDCANRYDDLISGRLDWGEDNVPNIMGVASRAALDPRLIDSSLPQDPDGKIATAAMLAARMYHETTGVVLEGVDGTHNLTLQIFLDNYKSSDGTVNLYNDLIRGMVQLGVDKKHIVVAQDYNTPARKLKVQKLLNAGDVRIIIGSTKVMGEGWNIQRLAYAQIQIDAPWTPTGITQREGRIGRPGNLLREIRIVRLVTSESLDFYRWHLLETKLGFVFQIAKRGLGQRSIEDIDQAIVGFAQMKAIAAGNALVLRQVELQAKLNTLYTLRQKWAIRQAHVRRNLETIPIDIKRTQAQIEIAKREKAAVEPLLPRVNGAFDMIIEGDRYTNEIDGRRALQRAINTVVKRANRSADRRRVGYIGRAALHVETDGVGSTGVVELGDGLVCRMELARRGDASMRRLYAALQSLTTKPHRLKQRVWNLERDVVRYGEMEQPRYEREAELIGLEQQLSRIEADMEAEASKGKDK